MMRVLLISTLLYTVSAQDAAAATPAPEMAEGIYSKFTVQQAREIERSPVGKVISLLEELEAKVSTDGQAEKLSYNRYACWCEETQKAKKEAIAQTGSQIRDTKSLVEKARGAAAAAKVETEHLQKDIEANIASVQEAQAVRTQEASAFTSQQDETTRALAALEQAIVVIGGVQNQGFLEKSKSAQLLSVVKGVGNVLNMKIASKVVRDELAVVKAFVDHPQDFIDIRAKKQVSALQVSSNPFGDFAPASTQILAILKTMKAQFETDLEQAGEEEAIKAKTAGELISTKQQETVTMQETVEQTTRTEASEAKAAAEHAVELKNLMVELSDDEAYVEDIKRSCQQKAQEWSQRSAVRTEELAGIQEALKYLVSPEAIDTLNLSKDTGKFGTALSLVQLAAITETHTEGAPRAQAYKSLKSVASQTHNLELATLAASLKTGGRFEDIILQINKMIEALNREAKDDDEHRARCTSDVLKNNATIEDLNHDLAELGRKNQRLENEQFSLGQTLEKDNTEIAASKDDLKTMKTLRDSDNAMYTDSVSADRAASTVIQNTIDKMNRFYTKMSFGKASLLQQPVETTFQGGYGGRNEKASPIVSILTQIKKDVDNDIAVEEKEEADAVAQFNTNSKALEAAIEMQESSRNQVASDLAEAKLEAAEVTHIMENKNSDLNAQNEMKSALKTDCAWIETHFVDRREKRKLEMAGMERAIAVLKNAPNPSADVGYVGATQAIPPL